MPPGLEEQVAFWRNVYAVWSRGQVAIHDDRHLGLIYEVVALPGPIGQGYTDQQRALVRAREARWRARTAALEQRAVQGRPLNAEQQALLEKMDEVGGRGVVFGAPDRIRSQRGVKERFRRGLEISGRYDEPFRGIFRRYGLPEDLAYLPHVESSFQLNARSSAGATGVWQFIRSTGRQYLVVDRDIDERLDPIIAADGAARYLRDAYGRLGSWPLALTSYNHGVGGMIRAQARYGDDIVRIIKDYDGRYFGFASRNFYSEFLAARHVARQADRYFPGLQYDLPLKQEQDRLSTAVFLRDLARDYRLPQSTLIALNPAWLTPIKNGSRPLPALARVWLPAGTLASARLSARQRDRVTW
jgi:membrane-bound lytic murein transglycosylase D